MDNERFIVIRNLAETIAEEHICDCVVDPYKIADCQSIAVISGNYEDYFLGELVFDTGEFFIHLNYDQLSDENMPRTRFTLAHELGHYFIHDHRDLLMKGVSLHKSTFEGGINSSIEKEANFFASSLLMPEIPFRSLSKQVAPGIVSILKLSNVFNTSIESTIIRYSQLDLSPCMIIKWQETIIPKFISYSQTFSNLTGVKGKPNIKVNGEAIRRQFDLLESNNVESDYIEENSSLSKWIPTVSSQSKADLPCLEQTFKLGKHGGLTLLILKK